MFLRSLESLRKELQSKAVILLDGSQIPAVRWFRDGPSLPETPVGTILAPPVGEAPQAKPAGAGKAR